MTGSAASLAANVAVAEPSLVGRLIAAWPSAALIGSYELLMRQVRHGAVPNTESGSAALDEPHAVGEVVAAQAGAGDRTGQQPGRWVQAEVSVMMRPVSSQFGKVVLGGRPGAEDGVDLGVQPLLDVGVPGEQMVAVVSVPPRKNATSW
ncbi:hypothetical protein [Actinomadura rudentiformis]|uniref:hypothetical protein n=1 Tax=Actinomadura rudentiformis TaxID=359158 RepID=UPI0029904D86|nr:hypothetical protein [Actinomadura rudentiformis]